MSTIADQVGYFFGTHGPSVTLEVACGSSIVALALAANALQAGDCDYALVLGACVRRLMFMRIDLFLPSFRSTMDGRLNHITYLLHPT